MRGQLGAFTQGRSPCLPAVIGKVQRCGLASTALVLASIAGAQAEDVKPDAADLLFDRPQLASTQPGTVLTYSYARRSSDAGRFGPDLTDNIRLSIANGSDAGTRSVTIQMLTGAHQRPAGPFQDMRGNPVLSLVLEDSTQQLAARLGANPRYFKGAIRTALRERADVEPDAASSGGNAAQAWQVTIAPFKDDPHRDRMAGLDGLIYTFKVNDRVPGQIAEIDIAAPDGKGGVLFEEKVAYVTAQD